MNDKQSGFFRAVVPFVIGGVSGAIATSVIQPIDTFKVQIQVLSEKVGRAHAEILSIPNLILRLHHQNGLSVLYRGLGSAILRQIFYASARIGAYEASVKRLQSYIERKSNAAEKIILSLGAGAFGALIGNPFDVALIRRQSSISTNRNCYKSTFHAFQSIVTNQGPLYLWRGLNITICRVAIINLGQLAGKDLISDFLKRFQMKAEMHYNLTAFLASLLTSAISLPVDNIKVKLQKQDKSSTIYNGIADCLIKSIHRQGFLRLWVGLPIYFIRGTPHSFILLRTQQFLTSQWGQLSKH